MMKKLILILSVSTFLLCVAITSVVAAGNLNKRNYAECKNNASCNYSESMSNYIDNDNDGICDNQNFGGCHQNKSNDCKYIDENSDVTSYNKSNSCENVCPKASNYVDENDDGICDNYNTRQHHKNGKHSGKRCHE